MCAMMNLPRAERDVDRVKTHLGRIFEKSSISRRMTAAQIDDSEFGDETSFTLVRFLFASVAAFSRVTPGDRKFVRAEIERRRLATQKIAAVCRLWKKDRLPQYLWSAFIDSIWSEISAERALVKIAERKRGRPPYRAFGKLIEMLAQNYQKATGRKPVVKFEPTKVKHCYSGPFADLIEEVHSQAMEVWKASGFKPTQLPTPNNQEARLDYARKALQPGRSKPKVI